MEHLIDFEVENESGKYIVSYYIDEGDSSVGIYSGPVVTYVKTGDGKDYVMDRFEYDYFENKALQHYTENYCLGGV